MRTKEYAIFRLTCEAVVLTCLAYFLVFDRHRVVILKGELFYWIMVCLMFIMVTVGCFDNRSLLHRLIKRTYYNIFFAGKQVKAFEEKAILPNGWPVNELQLPSDARNFFLPFWLQKNIFEFVQETRDDPFRPGKAAGIGFQTGLKWDEMVDHVLLALKPMHLTPRPI